MKQLVDCCLWVCNELASCLNEIYTRDESLSFDLSFYKEKVEKVYFYIDGYGRYDYLFYLESSGDMYFNPKIIDKIDFALNSKVIRGLEELFKELMKEWL